MVFIVHSVSRNVGIGYKPFFYSYDLLEKERLIKTKVKECLLNSFGIFKEFNVNVGYKILKERYFKDFVNKTLFIYDNLIYYITDYIYGKPNIKINIDLYSLSIKEEKEVLDYNEIGKYIGKVVFGINFLISGNFSLLNIVNRDSKMFLDNIVSGYLNYLNINIPDMDKIEFNVGEIKKTSDNNLSYVSIPVQLIVKIYDTNFCNKLNKNVFVQKAKNGKMYKNKLKENIKILNGSEKYNINNEKRFFIENGKCYMLNAKSIQERNNKENYIKFAFSDDKIKLEICVENEKGIYEKFEKFDQCDYQCAISLYKDIYRKINKSFTTINKYRDKLIKGNRYTNLTIADYIIKSMHEFKKNLLIVKQDIELLNMLLD